MPPPYPPVLPEENLGVVEAGRLDPAPRRENPAPDGCLDNRQPSVTGLSHSGTPLGRPGKLPESGAPIESRAPLPVAAPISTRGGEARRLVPEAHRPTALP